jgi:hypothetical protein
VGDPLIIFTVVDDTVISRLVHGGRQTAKGIEAEDLPPFPLPSQAQFAALQVLLFIGVVSTAAGYLGCFTIVQNARPRDTYIWLCLEIFLAFLRIILWAWNPAWDEGTGIRLHLQLADHAPMVTIAQDYDSLIIGQSGQCDPFVVVPAKPFLGSISSYTGPVQGFRDPDNHVAIYYTLAGHLGHRDKVLLTTVLDMQTRGTFVLLHHCPLSNAPSRNNIPTVYTATTEIIPDGGIMTARCVGIFQGNFRHVERLGAIQLHSEHIANRIGGVDRATSLYISWGFSVNPLSVDIHVNPRLHLENTQCLGSSG